MYFKLISFREMKQMSAFLYKLLNRLSQEKIPMTLEQQVFCRQIVERVSLACCV